MEAIPPEVAPAVAEYFEAQLSTGEYPHVEALLGEGDRWAGLVRLLLTAAGEQDRFERGLARLLDGVELDIERRRARGAAT